MENYSTVPGYSLYNRGKVTIRTDRNFDDGKAKETVTVWVGDREFSNGDSEENLSRTIVRGASIRDGILTVNTTVISFEGDATRNFDYRFNVETGEALNLTETVEYEGGEPGSTIVTHTTIDPSGEILNAGREVVWNE